MLKYWICKRAPVARGRGLECLGGNGYVEESGMPRLYREAPLNSIWEGSGNVQCLDVLRAMVKNPDSVEAFFAEVGEGAVRAAARRLRRRAARGPQPTSTGIESRARRSSSGWRSRCRARCSCASATRPSPTRSVASRLAGDWGHAFGTLPPGTDFARIIDRHRATA